MFFGFLLKRSNFFHILIGKWRKNRNLCFFDFAKINAIYTVKYFNSDEDKQWIKSV